MDLFKNVLFGNHADYGNDIDIESRNCPKSFMMCTNNKLYIVDTRKFMCDIEGFSNFYHSIS